RGDCDPRREHRLRKRPGLADAAHSSRGRRQRWWRHGHFRAFDRAAAGGDSRPSGRGREPRWCRRHHGSGGGREVPQGWLHRVHDEQCARDFGRDVQGAALRPHQRLPNGVDGRDRRSRSCGRARLSARDLAGVLAAVRANPGKFNFGSAGVGTTQHFAGELMKQTAGLDITHVPYRSTPAAVTGLRAREVEFVFELVQTVQGQIHVGDLKAIAVTSPKRNPMLPDVPTFTEAGMPGYDVTSWYGLAFPAGTAPAIVQKTNKAMQELLG